MVEDVEREQRAAAERSIREGRARIARELHDVVAHHLSLMVIQAGSARRLVEQDPQRAKEALTVIEEYGRRGLDAMPGLLRALRTENPIDELAPQPRLAELPGLIDQLHASGLPVSLDIEGSPWDLPEGIDAGQPAAASSRPGCRCRSGSHDHPGDHRRRSCARQSRAEDDLGRDVQVRLAGVAGVADLGQPVPPLDLGSLCHADAARPQVRQQQMAAAPQLDHHMVPGWMGRVSRPDRLIGTVRCYPHRPCRRLEPPPAGHTPGMRSDRSAAGRSGGRTGWRD
jgi:hypothetical protein